MQRRIIIRCAILCCLWIHSAALSAAADQESAEATLKRAKDLVDAEKAREAIPILNALIKQDPRNADALALRGAAEWAATKDWHAALADYTQATRLAPKNAAFRFARGQLRIEAGDTREALRDLNVAVSLDPKSEAYLALRGHVRFELLDVSGAFLDFSRLIEINPNDARYYLGRGMTWDTSDRKSLDDYTKAIELKPDFAFAFVRRGFTHLWWGQQAEAQADFDQALKLDPSMKGEIDYETEFVKQNRARK